MIYNMLCMIYIYIYIIHTKRTRPTIPPHQVDLGGPAFKAPAIHEFHKLKIRVCIHTYVYTYIYIYIYICIHMYI